ncbi:hypothetical protein B7463_g8482, partial [Scytalidium lignicola]
MSSTPLDIAPGVEDLKVLLPFYLLQLLQAERVSACYTISGKCHSDQSHSGSSEDSGLSATSEDFSRPGPGGPPNWDQLSIELPDGHGYLELGSENPVNSEEAVFNDDFSWVLPEILGNMDQENAMMMMESESMEEFNSHEYWNQPTENAVISPNSSLVAGASAIQQNRESESQLALTEGTSSRAKSLLPCTQPGCKSEFKDRHALNHHLRYHQKRYECPHPSHTEKVAFSLEKDLKRHQKTHNSESERELERHYCQYCGEGFTRADNKKRHEDTKHSQT